MLALLAWSSRPTVEIGTLNLRVEQPAILLVGLLILWQYRPTLQRLARANWPLAVGIAIWMGAGLVSALFVAPDPMGSLRILVWWVASIAAGVVAMTLAARSDPETVGKVFVVTGLAHAGVAIYAFVVGGIPGLEWGGYVFELGIPQYRAFGLAWEPNILASSLAMLMPFAVDRYVRVRGVIPLVAVGVIAIGVGLALTRAAWIALAIGAVVVLVTVVATRPQRLQRLATAGAVAVVGIALGSIITLSWLPAPPTAVEPGPTSSPAATTQPGESEAAPGSGPLETPPPTESPRPTRAPVTAQVLLNDRNVQYRMQRVLLAVADLQTSPAVGMGPGSFGQRHLDPSQSFDQDHLPVFPLTILYDVGVIGFLGFSIFGLALLRRLVRRDVLEVTAPYLASLVIMGVAYVSTDALRFSHNWLVMGAALGVVATAVARRPSSS